MPGELTAKGRSTRGRIIEGIADLRRTGEVTRR